MANLFIILACLSGAVGVGLGAFGAHALRTRLNPTQGANFETGVRYQMYHSLALLATAILMPQLPGARLAVIAGWCFAAGVLLFSGSLYLLASGAPRRWGAVTPLGGAAFIAGWICLALAAMAG